jgi:adenylosuccinate synthase
MQHSTSITALIGGQFGSEGKGVIVAHIADQFNVHVRVGGPNAGHSFYHEDKKWVMQQIPCGWINPNAVLYIGPAGMVYPRIFKEEIDAIESAGYDIRNRLFINPHTSILDEHHFQREGGTEGSLHHRIGSTGEGCGACRMDRLKRDPASFRRAGDVDDIPWLQKLVGTPKQLGDWNVLLEGTQGFGLSLIHGAWPFVTTGCTGAAQLLADSGMPWGAMKDVIAVVRTYPIRVAGTSGPMEGELTWDYMSERIGRPVKEITTVTKKVRRIGGWDEARFLYMCEINRPTAIALTFLDYLDPKMEDADALTSEASRMVSYVESLANCPVKYVGVGGPQWKVLDR